MHALSFVTARNLVAAGLLAATPVAMAQPVHAEARVSGVELPVRFAGLPVGKMEYSVRVEGGSYTVDGTGATGGIGRLASSASSTFRARGRLTKSGPLPRSHSVSYRDGAKEGTAAIKFAKGRVASVSETPPPTPRKDRVPVTEAMLEGAIDPTSAMIVPAPRGADIASVCGRTLKISDARNVFLLRLTPKTSGKLADGTPYHRCAVRYSPLGGHRESSKGVARFSRNRSLTITYAPLFRKDGSGSEGNVWGLVGFRMKTRFGIVRGTADGIDAV